MSPKQVQPNNDPLARMTAMQEANARQKASIDRLMAERTVLLDLLSAVHQVAKTRVWNSDEVGPFAEVAAKLKDSGYDV